MTIATISNGEAMSSVRTKLNEVIGLTNSGCTIVVGSPITLTGTSVTFTAPANAVLGFVSVVGMSTGGTSIPLLQLGDAGGYEATGYNSAGGYSTTSALSTIGQTTGFGLAGNITAAAVLNLNIIIARANISTNTWTVSIGGGTSVPTASYGGGTKSLSEALTGGRFIMVNGTDSFDAGTFNIIWVVQNV